MIIEGSTAFSVRGSVLRFSACQPPAPEGARHPRYAQ